DMLARHGVESCERSTDGLQLAQPAPVEQLPGFAEGFWSVQDISAQRAVPLLPLADGMRVLDACAAPGGKSAHLLERASLELLALDTDAHRMKRVSLYLDRLWMEALDVNLRC